MTTDTRGELMRRALPRRALQRRLDCLRGDLRSMFGSQP